ncbi:hypothetical protein B0T17DRAFT_656983 [Bombardia bombarda]|uniref:VOC domain-containing protein n=1 Tax=Bombardia bombarda TaxID=252184 RepID=A0AA40BW93_9PEZI|nr:hypothetical protein B0T17DRAFT_656983 [Bombardia bombarda]
MALASAHIRIARPTNNTDALLPFYCNGLGFEVLGSFTDHEGFDGVMLGHKSAGYHLEFTRDSAHDAGRAPTQDNLLVFYLPDKTTFVQAVAQMENNGFAAVTSLNPYWDRCGKTFEDADGYRVVLAETAYPSYDPGGQTEPPVPSPDAPLLYVQFKPRYSLYLDSEPQGEIIVNAELSDFFGSPWPARNSSSTTSNQFSFSIHVGDNEENILLASSSVAVNTTGNIFTFDLSTLTPSLAPINLTLRGTGPQQQQAAFTATSELLYLPEKTNGSVTKLDNLNGGMLFRNAASGNRFVPLLPYGFYSSYDGFLAKNDTGVIQDYADLGLNAMTPLTIYRDAPGAFAYFDKIDLKFMYDLREGYKNLTYVREQVLAARDAEAIFAYWSTDERLARPLRPAPLAYTLLHALDPYHPVALVLNCQNYYFASYSAGADILMEDVYPIGINATFSKWGTACNATLGDCGCDNCAGSVFDVPHRLDDLSKYERWLGRWPKTKLHNPQSFHGEGYWGRDPTVQEAWAMNALAVNHGAQGFVSWVWPASGELGAAHGEMMSTPWGGVQWTLEGGKLSVGGLPGLATSMVIIELE